MQLQRSELERVCDLEGEYYSSRAGLLPLWTTAFHGASDKALALLRHLKVAEPY
jgi:hypothetical protein